MILLCENSGKNLEESKKAAEERAERRKSVKGRGSAIFRPDGTAHTNGADVAPASPSAPAVAPQVCSRVYWST